MADPIPTGPRLPGRRVRFKTLGCKVNRVESDTAASALLGQGWEVVEAGPADVIVVNTCTVTAEADSKARKEIRRALGTSGAPLVVVTGCLASLSPEELGSMSPRVVVETDRDAVAKCVAASSAAVRATTSPTPVAARARTRAMVKVQDGCEQRCSYCIVPDARGLPRSRPLDDVVAEVTALASAGVGEIVVTGVNLGAWRDGEADLPALLDAVCAAAAGRVRLSSIEPTHVADRFVEVAARRIRDGSLCPHFHVPLQSGSDQVLAAMRRPYDTTAFRCAVAALARAIPHVALTTDVIAGFPGETAADTDSTLRFIEEIAFQRVHVFRYSERPGTPATKIMPRVPAAERSVRAAALRTLSARLLAGYTAGRIGTHARVLIERNGVGTTEDYLKVSVEDCPAPPGSLVDVVLGDPLPNGTMTGLPLTPPTQWPTTKGDT